MSNDNQDNLREELLELGRTTPEKALSRFLWFPDERKLIAAEEFAEWFRKTRPKSIHYYRNRLTDCLEPDYIAACADAAPGNTLISFPEKLSNQQFDKCITKAPAEALRNCKSRLSDDQFDLCVEAAPEEALWSCREQLNEKQKQYCIVMVPHMAINVHINFGFRLSPKEFAYCIQKEPGIALKEGVVERLSWEQLLSCIEQAPGEALKNKIVERLSPSLFASCIESAPRAALEFAVNRLTSKQFEMCIDLVSDMELVAVTKKLFPAAFSYCIEIESDPHIYLKNKLLTQEQREKLKKIFEDSKDRPSSHSPIKNDAEIPNKASKVGCDTTPGSSRTEKTLNNFFQNGGMDAMMEVEKLDEHHVDRKIVNLKMGMTLNILNSMIEIGLHLLVTSPYKVINKSGPKRRAKAIYAKSKGNLVLYLFLFTQEKHALDWMKRNPEEGFESIEKHDLSDTLRAMPETSIAIILNQGSKPYDVLLDSLIVDNIYNFLVHGQDAVQRIIDATGNFPTRRI